MLKTIKSIGVTLGLLMLSTAGFFTSCQDKMKDYYEEPSWIKGSIYEILEERGTYSLFLAAVDRCDYTSLLKGRAILTVMAPDDDAMRSYLQENYGTTSVESVPVSELKKLVGFHLLYYSFDKQKLVNFRPEEGDGATAEEKAVNAGLYYKFRTRSQDAPSKENVDRIYNASTSTYTDTTDVIVDVYHLERFIPVFSYEYFNTKLIDAKYNYEYFFPASDWTGGTNGFNVSDAEVTEYEIIAKNGYIYTVDRVIRPLETIHTELAQNPEYSMFLDMYDKYDYYAIDDDLTNLYGGGTTTYYQRHYNSGQNRLMLADIASEWPVSSYNAMSALSSTAYSVFAPTNAAFREFYQQYWGDAETGYPTEVSYDSLGSEVITYLLSNSIYRKPVFPEEITKGEIENGFTGTTISFDVDAVPEANRKMCVNGMLYGQSILTPPAVFGSVTGPAYKYKRYSIFLTMLTASDMQSTLTSNDVNFIMLYPSNAEFGANNIWWDAETSKIKNGIPGSTTSSNVGSAEQANFVNSHIVSLQGPAEELPTTGLHVYRTLNTNYKLYWYVKDGRITNSFRYNQLIEYSGNTGQSKDSVYTDFAELTFRGGAWTNGHCYQYDTRYGRFLMPGSNSEAIYPRFVPMMYAHRNDEGTLFQGFIQTLMLAGMIDEQSQEMVYMTEDCMMLVPTTTAIKEAILAGRFPYVTTTATSVDDPSFWSLCSAPADGSDEQLKLQHYMLEYFLPESTSPATEYPYPGWNQDTEGDGGIPSIADVTVTPAASAYIYIYDRPSGMTAKVAGMSQEVSLVGDYDYLPFVFDDGCVQFMDGIFENKWPE